MRMKKELSEYLVDTIWKYKQQPTLKKAIECLHWINCAYYYGLIKENSHALIKKSVTRINKLEISK
jgi:hypothetical protein